MSTAPARSPDVRTWLFLGALVAVLAGVVVWSLGPRPPEPQDAERDAGVVRPDGAIEYTTSPLLVVHPPKQAATEFAVVTDRREEDLGPLTDPKALAALITPRHCGGACTHVRELVANKAYFETEVVKAADYILPPEDSWKAIAPTLDDRDRARLHAMPNVVVVKTHHPTGREQWAARMGFAVTQALAESLGGYVYDETLRRIETSAAFATHALIDGEDQNALRPDRYVVQSYRESGGTLRFVTLGLIRFGVFDFEAREIPGQRASEASLLMGKVARMLAMGGTWPFPLAPEGNAAPNRSTVKFDFIEGVPTEGDPDTLGGRLLPLEASWDVAFEKLYGPPGSVAFDPNDPKLLAIAKRTRENLPRLEAARARGARLLVKYRMRVKDAAAEVEEVWMLVRACTKTTQPKDAQCEGELRSNLAASDEFHIGDKVRTPVSEIVDAILESPDGGREGGESERVLR